MTVDYSMEGLILVPTIHRKQHLSDHFACECPRCNVLSGDETRQFRCSSTFKDCSVECKCEGYHLIQQNSVDEKAAFHACCICGRLANESFEKYMLELECSLLEQVNFYEYVLDDVLSDTSERDLAFYNVTPSVIESLNCFSDSHYLAYRIAKLKYTFYMSALGGEDSTQALTMKQEQIAVLIKICKSKPSRTLAFQYEIVGELATELKQYELAKESLEEALRLQIIVSGADSPYTACVQRAIDALRTLMSLT